ncbi:hypothetical protein HID58_048822 [Brassica napus]|uniref:Uncharacterized protein n=5 Tax=Brassica TaxID=3705 RepID=A0ABQ8B370_BRANA|nr:PREDICTED: aquaporin TIP2-3 [Brassica oleracea var. oleracea]XP_013715959.2 aquaporin TIP2-3 [Brassica napus]KAH0899254.1 hypothetical protein HID58_048822 [Brassica napus]
MGPIVTCSSLYRRTRKKRAKLTKVSSKKSMVKIEVGSVGDSFSVASLKAYLSEFIATLIFVFAGVGSAIAFGKLTSDAALDPAGLVAIAVAHAFALFVGVSIAANISGGHLNPAVTLGLAVGGNITLITGFLYWIAQCLGSIVACLLLVYVTNGESVPTHGVGAGLGALEGIVMEIVVTFALVYTVYATAADPKKGSLGTIAPIAIGFIVGANILAAGPFSGGSMNPARSFGPSVVSGDLSQIWIYWVGPLVGGGLAGLIYGDVFIGSYQEVETCEIRV